jgi:hypothetical protein
VWRVADPAVVRRVRAQDAAAERRRERERQDARRREEEEFDSLDGRDMARFLDSQASQAVGQRGVQIVLVRSGLPPAPPLQIRREHEAGRGEIAYTEGIL